MIYQNKAETYTGGKVVFIPSQSYSSTNHVKTCKKPYHKYKGPLSATHPYISLSMFFIIINVLFIKYQLNAAWYCNYLRQKNSFVSANMAATNSASR